MLDFNIPQAKVLTKLYLWTPETSVHGLKLLNHLNIFLFVEDAISERNSINSLI